MKGIGKVSTFGFCSLLTILFLNAFGSELILKILLHLCQKHLPFTWYKCFIIIEKKGTKGDKKSIDGNM